MCHYTQLLRATLTASLMLVGVAGAAVSVLLSASSFAQSGPPRCVTTFDQRTIRAMNNLQAEITTCVAYYNLRSQCTPPDSISETVKNENKLLIDDQTKFAHVVGRGICMTDDAMLARLELDFKEQKKLIEDSCVNFDSLVRRYAERCKTVVENADAILDEYMKK
jgi:hypothetical protein